MKKPKDWELYIAEALSKTVEGILETGKRINEFKLSCDSKNGGSEFSESLKHWYGFSPATASLWTTIGANNAKLFNAVKKLPASFSTIYHIATLDDASLDAGIKTGKIHQSIKSLF